tara:strand:- start:7728 stop:8426 length:699 start_codon:yes stop_codon:yes gene_type:complete
MNFIEDIRKHFKRQYPREACGVISVVKGKKKWYPCENISEEDEHFLIDTDYYLKLTRTTDVIGIVHSHPDASSEPSEFDIASCNALGKDFYIFSYPEMDLTVLHPENKTTNLYGREYEFGVQDCFEALRDYLSSENIKIPPRVMFVEDYWDKNIDYFNEKTIKNWNHYPVNLNSIQKNDVLIFKIFSNINNHCGVYLGNDIFYHHAEERLSCRENLYPLWHKWLVGAYRYAA